MRISTGKLWLAATTLVIGAAHGRKSITEPGAAMDTITFSDDFGQPAIIELGERGNTNKTFRWRAQDRFVEEIILQCSDPNPPGTPEIIARGVPIIDLPPQAFKTSPTKSLEQLQVLVTGSPASREAANGILRRQDEEIKVPFQLHVESSLKGGNVAINLVQFPDKYSGRPLYLEAIWGGSGHSYSRNFTVVHSKKFGDFTLENGDLYKNTSPYKEEQKPTGNAEPSANTPTPSSTPNTGSPANAGGSTTDSKAGRLPQGAVIGIAVGAGILGLIIIFAFVWLVVRRQRRKQQLLHIDSYKSGNHHTDDLIAEKEAHAGVDVTIPQSPYSDDGNGPTAPASTSATAVSSTHLHHQPQQQDPNQTFTPYTDRSSAALRQADDGRASVVPSPIPGRGTPRDLTTPYAHLVEEGMTEDDVRRLEEEERQLDAAIEQARRR